MRILWILLILWYILSFFFIFYDAIKNSKKEDIKPVKKIEAVALID
ncbi:MAG TPA: hypothetical protein VE933_03940 [Chitinophagaceae bacterium]|nr:hypothetical protein [Chitinophagaceae bacterium]